MNARFLSSQVPDIGRMQASVIDTATKVIFLTYTHHQ